MGKQYKVLKDKDIDFIKEQKLFYIASCSGREVNLAPKGYDTIRIINESTLIFLSYPGSGNRSFRDTQADGEFTLLFNAFVGAPQIVRLFCKAEIIESSSKDFNTYLSLYEEEVDVVRNLFKFNIYAVESSCGMSVPIMKYEEDRAGIKDWTKDMSKSKKLDGYMEKYHVPRDLNKL